MNGDPLDYPTWLRPLHVHLDLASTTDAGRIFRITTRESALAARLGPGLLQSSFIVGTELVNNAVLHGAAPVRVDITLEAEHLHIDVSDASHESPVARPTPRHIRGGRVLHLLALLATSWGTRDTTTGKTVGCCLSTTAGPSSADPPCVRELTCGGRTSRSALVSPGGVRCCHTHQWQPTPEVCPTEPSSVSVLEPAGAEDRGDGATGTG